MTQKTCPETEMFTLVIHYYMRSSTRFENAQNHYFFLHHLQIVLTLKPIMYLKDNICFHLA